MPAFLQRTTAWLCMAIAVLAGLTPVQGFVLCLEADGDVCIELATAAETCSGCVDDARDATPSSEKLVASSEPCCPCWDMAVPGFAQDRQIVHKSSEIQFGPWSAIAPAPSVARVGSHLLCVRERPIGAPRPAQSLALIRTIVLLI